jgi:4a-hydroxytetrahydrobiopterin dehydratase
MELLSVFFITSLVRSRRAIGFHAGRRCILQRMETAYPDGWDVVDGALEREFRFNDLAAAMDFVNRVAELAEEANHHPDIAVHYNRVVLRFWTHSESAITERDVQLAERAGTLT